MNPFSIVADFENEVANYAGAEYAIAVDCCTSALFLSMMWKGVKGKEVTIPARTYCSVPMAVIHAGGVPVFEDEQWSGVYELRPYRIWDGAKRFTSGMYRGGLHCLSFHAKKHLPIGRGGMILTDDDKAADWLRKARYDGREGKPYPDEEITTLGWHCYMTPEQAARGLQLLSIIGEQNMDLQEQYPDLREMPVFQPYVQRIAA